MMACASELAGTDVALTILPSGTGNLLATNLGLSSDVRAGIARPNGAGAAVGAGPKPAPPNGAGGAAAAAAAGAANEVGG